MSNVRLNLLSLIYILMNTRKDYVTIHLQLTEIDVLEVVTLLRIYIIEYVFQKRQKI